MSINDHRSSFDIVSGNSSGRVITASSGRLFSKPITMNILSRAIERGNTVRMLKRHKAIKKCCAAFWVYFDLVSLAQELMFIMESTCNGGVCMLA